MAPVAPAGEGLFSRPAAAVEVIKTLAPLPADTPTPAPAAAVLKAPVPAQAPAPRKSVVLEEDVDDEGSDFEMGEMPAIEMGDSTDEEDDD